MWRRKGERLLLELQIFLFFTDFKHVVENTWNTYRTSVVAPSVKRLE